MRLSSFLSFLIFIRTNILLIVNLLPNCLRIICPRIDVLFKPHCTITCLRQVVSSGALWGHPRWAPLTRGGEHRGRGFAPTGFRSRALFGSSELASGIRVGSTYITPGVNIKAVSSWCHSVNGIYIHAQNDTGCIDWLEMPGPSPENK